VSNAIAPSVGAEPGLQSVERAINLLQVLAANGPARVSELARELGVHKSTASRLLATLERRGLADRVGDGATFVLGNGVALLAAHAARPRAVSEVARPVLNELVLVTGETVSFNVLTEDAHVLTLYQAIGPSGLTGFNWLGQRSSALATAAGKVLLSHRTAGEAEELVPTEVPAMTEQTPTRAEFLAELPTVRSLGFATSRDELELGLSALAAPVFDSSGVIGAVSASGPTARIFGDRHREIIARVVRAAQEISVRMGSVPAPDLPA
jgi:DNA-binding IclR family transcriptional regulator